MCHHDVHDPFTWTDADKVASSEADSARLEKSRHTASAENLI